MFAAATVAMTVLTLAGTPGVAGSLDGGASVASFNRPTALAIDERTATVYVTDRVNNEVRLIRNGAVSTMHLSVLGSGTVPDLVFGGPFGGGIAIEPNGRCGPDSLGYGKKLYVVSSGNHTIVKVTPDGSIAQEDTYGIGNPGVAGSADVNLFLQGVPPAFATQALLNAPTAVAIDARHYSDVWDQGEILVADTGNHTIRRIGRGIDLEGCRYDTSFRTYAGKAGEPGNVDGPLATARFNAPRGLAFAPDGSLYIADTGNSAIRHVVNGVVTTVATGLSLPTGIDVDATGNVVFAETGNHVIRRLNVDGTLETVAGTLGVPGYAGGDAKAARFSGPVGIKIAADGAILVADTSNQVIRKIVVAPPQTRRRAISH